ncbi:hypothetical protein [Streptomyces sp. NPDC057682]|uniref:hypothetical protein n=1 Tax=Streptomyces sp. NPDC057682 TaxID=3346210 RepID=UPI0036AD65AC
MGAREERAGFARLALPRIRLEWPDELAPVLRESVQDRHTLDSGKLCAELPFLWRAVDAALERVGPGCLVPESIRYDPYEGWQVAALPRYDPEGGLQLRDGVEPARPRARDRSALVQALVDAVAERPSADQADALALLDVLAGTFPLGLDAVCHRLLLDVELRRGVAPGMAALHEALERRPGGPVSAVCFRESAVGSRKAKGDPERDNEDAATALRAADGTLRMAVFDGVTGDGDGSGGRAARAATECLVRLWKEAEAGAEPPPPAGEPPSPAAAPDFPGPGAAVPRTGPPRPAAPHPSRRVLDRPRALVGELDRVVERTGGGAAAVLATVTPDGTAEVISVGDAEAWLVRPLAAAAVRPRELPYTAWKLTPAHTAYAERLRGSSQAHGDTSALTSALGDGTARWAHRVFSVAPGDLLVLASDGATAGERGRWTGEVLAAMAADLEASGRPVAPALAAGLMGRAEALGGWDNATALVCAVGEG